jgi:hypothetical protein
MVWWSSAQVRETDSGLRSFGFLTSDLARYCPDLISDNNFSSLA